MEKTPYYNYKFVDIHNHILHRVDDGSKSLEQSLEMLKIAMSENIGAICLTPHYRAGITDNIKTDLNAKYNDLKLAARQRFPDVELFLGNELFYNDDSISALDQGLCTSINGGRYVLVEFNPDCEFLELKRGLDRLINGGYRPIIAHIERYKCLQNRISRLDEIAHMGGYIQVNASAIVNLGYFGKGAWIRKLLKRDCIHIVATDCHNISNRAPLMLECAEVLSKYGNLYPKQLLHENPLCVLYDEKI